MQSTVQRLNLYLSWQFTWLPSGELFCYPCREMVRPLRKHFSATPARANQPTNSLFSFMHYDNASKVGHGKSLMRAGGGGCLASPTRLPYSPRPTSLPLPLQKSIAGGRNKIAMLAVWCTSTSTLKVGYLSRHQSEVAWLADRHAQHFAY